METCIPINGSMAPLRQDGLIAQVAEVTKDRGCAASVNIMSATPIAVLDSRYSMLFRRLVTMAAC